MTQKRGVVGNVGIDYIYSVCIDAYRINEISSNTHVSDYEELLIVVDALRRSRTSLQLNDGVDCIHVCMLQRGSLTYVSKQS